MVRRSCWSTEHRHAPGTIAGHARRRGPDCVFVGANDEWKVGACSITEAVSRWRAARGVNSQCEGRAASEICSDCLGEEATRDAIGESELAAFVTAAALRRLGHRSLVPGRGLGSRGCSGKQLHGTSSGGDGRDIPLLLLVRRFVGRGGNAASRIHSYSYSPGNCNGRGPHGRFAGLASAPETSRASSRSWRANRGPGPPHRLARIHHFCPAYDGPSRGQLSYFLLTKKESSAPRTAPEGTASLHRRHVQSPARALDEVLLERPGASGRRRALSVTAARRRTRRRRFFEARWWPTIVRRRPGSAAPRLARVAGRPPAGRRRPRRRYSIDDAGFLELPAVVRGPRPRLRPTIGVLARD